MRSRSVSSRAAATQSRVAVAQIPIWGAPCRVSLTRRLQRIRFWASGQAHFSEGRNTSLLGLLRSGLGRSRAAEGAEAGAVRDRGIGESGGRRDSGLPEVGGGGGRGAARAGGGRRSGDRGWPGSGSGQGRSGEGRGGGRARVLSRRAARSSPSDGRRGGRLARRRRRRAEAAGGGRG